jgi:endonuclease YncB( thermonuclease family)
MPYLLIEGNYRIVGGAPDGDSIKFYPHKVARWDQLEALGKTHRIRQNKDGGVQLRLDAIDALETHYTPGVSGASVEHQPLKFAHAARDTLLKFLGFTKVVQDSNEKVTSSTPAEVPGYLLSKFVDAYGRAVSFIYRGTPPERDGSTVFVDAAMLKHSANHHLLAQGLAYPTYYSGLYFELRGELTKAVASARKGKGLWPEDRTTKGFELKTATTLNDDVVILPKLFRRLSDYLELNQGSLSLSGLENYLRARNDELVVLDKGQKTGLHFLVEVKGREVRMKEPPENLMFLEK